MSSPVVELHGAPLVRFWLDRGLIDPVAPTQNLGGRLGQWLDVRQAIRLHQLLGAETVVPASHPTRAGERVRQAQETLGQLRDAISNDRFAPGLWRNPMPVDVSWQPLVWVECWEPYRRYLLDHQKQLTLVLGRLRRQLRAALGQAGGVHQALAHLDAVYDETLTPLETRLLARLPDTFEQRLSERVKALDLMAEPEPAVATAAHRPPRPRWLPDFEQELRQSLLTELDLRAQPLLGLMDVHQTLRP